LTWRLFVHVAIDYQPLTRLNSGKPLGTGLLWVAVVNRNVGKRDAPVPTTDKRKQERAGLEVTW